MSSHQRTTCGGGGHFRKITCLWDTGQNRGQGRGRDGAEVGDGGCSLVVALLIKMSGPLKYRAGGVCSCRVTDGIRKANGLRALLA